MESHDTTKEQGTLSEKKESGLGNVYCKMGKGWTCVISRSEGPDAGKVFVKCGENSTCTLNGETMSKEENMPPDDAVSSQEAFCKCGEGWSCEILRTEGSAAECSGSHCS